MRKTPATIAIEATMGGMVLLGGFALLGLSSPWWYAVPVLFVPANYFFETARQRRKEREDALVRNTEPPG